MKINNKFSVTGAICRKAVVLLTMAGLMLSMTGCKYVNSVVKDLNAQHQEKNQKAVEEKAPEYGIDPEGVTVESNGTYFRVPVHPYKTADEMDEYIVLMRKWLRFAYAELGRRYFVGFFDKDHPEVMYCGFSDQDLGYDSEFYWNDHDILQNYLMRVRSFTRPSRNPKEGELTPEEFNQKTGINENVIEELYSWFNEKYPSKKDVTPDKSEHDVTFIPGDTINHKEKFTVGDDKCPIAAGKYSVDLPNKRGLIHVTDSNGNTKYRLDGCYREGHADGMYSYLELPATLELNNGDIIYIINCVATFDRAD